MFDKKSILITGGTGSFGKAWVRYILKKYKNIKYNTMFIFLCILFIILFIIISVIRYKFILLCF